MYTLPETNIAMENPPCSWYLAGKMVIFMGYVSFREANQRIMYIQNDHSRYKLFLDILIVKEFDYTI